MPRGESQRDIISSIAARRFGQERAVDTLDIIPGWGDLDTLNTTNALDAWYNLFRTAPSFSPEDNFRSGEQIQSIRTEINEYLALHNIDLAAIEKGRITMPRTLAVLFTKLHQEATILAIKNIRLLKTASEEIEGFSSSTDYDKTSAFSYGFEGLLSAAKKYDPWYHHPDKKGQPEQFSSFAIPVIKSKMRRGFSAKEIIRIPENMREITSLYRKATDHLRQELGSFTHEQIVAAVDYYLEKKIMPNRSVLDTVFGRQNTRSFDRLNERIIAALQASHVKSIDKVRKVRIKTPEDSGPDTYDTTIGDNLVDETEPYREVFVNQRDEAIQRALELLSPKERKVLELRFGLVDGREWTLLEVGQELGINKETARRYEKQALRRLRHPTRRRGLADFVE